LLSAVGRPRPQPVEEPSHLHIVAHPDDDLFFLNPDLQQAIGRGESVLTVCLTCAESEGKNFRGDDPRHATATVDYESFAAARRNGLLAAYAQMAAGDLHSPWDRSPVTTAAGRVAEMCTLRAAPHIRLLFLNMWQEGGRAPEGRPARLRRLWIGETERQPVMASAGIAGPQPDGYTRQSLIDTLVTILDEVRPSVIRTMDPDPAHQVHDGRNRQHADYGDYSDHIDHTPTGLFAWAAVQEHLRQGRNEHLVVEGYRGYFNERWPFNLGATALREKLTLLDIYGWADEHECDRVEGCGDRTVGDGAAGSRWAQSTTYRYPGDTTWMQPGPDGRLYAFAVLGGRLMMWREKRPGGDNWEGPVPVGGGEGRLLPAVSVVLSGDGRWYVFGVRMTLDADPARQRRDLVVITQDRPGKRFTDWVVLGNPYNGKRHDPVKRRGIGVPVAVRAADGSPQVFLRNYWGGASGRAWDAAANDWSGWLDLNGSSTQDGFTAVTLPDGRTEVYAAARSGVMRWYQEKPGGEFARIVLSMPAPAGPPTVLSRPGGGLLLVTRRPDTAEVLVHERPGPDAEWQTEPTVLGGHGGFGRVAAVTTADGGVALAHRNDDGTVSIGLLGSPESVRWQPETRPFAHSPALAVDARGRLTVGVIGLDGRLHISRPPVV
jgi:LmbE family N-acetylglucosaminyl deacetylase